MPTHARLIIAGLLLFGIGVPVTASVVLLTVYGWPH
jgi:hypothetical protein